ncbi:Aste57867_9218 [Aphanomyces stellatus]|uniref:Aste57867_9218 protein n=1 Tax=Aphanomyces stellatus TaxID=120398 RepID=A0A485KMB5_9STRA|nr:hypothetical protein As57867_009182 [Aphanomyces stellatus]VFT86101.1 Aste57867_9218 [Aphanomyces stellatus]
MDVRPMWFAEDAEIDGMIRERFGPLVAALLATETSALLSLLHDDANNTSVKIDAVLCLDQFTRNIYRDLPASLQGDAIAVPFVAQTMERHGAQIKTQHALEQSFFLVPLMHSEEKSIHELVGVYFRRRHAQTHLVQLCHLRNRPQAHHRPLWAVPQRPIGSRQHDPRRSVFERPWCEQGASRRGINK